MLDNKSKIFFGIFAFLVMASLVATYYRYVILKDFAIFTDEEAFNESIEE
jgi:hypothetical protein